MKYFYTQDISRNLILLLLVLSTTLTSFSQEQPCEAKLEVENNQISKKASIIGTSYRMFLTNLDSKTNTFLIDVENIQKSRMNYISMKGEVFPMNKRESLTNNANKKTSSNYHIALKGGESFEFIVELIAAKGVAIGDYNETEVRVSSDSCADFSITKLLQTEIVKSDIKNY